MTPMHINITKMTDVLTSCLSARALRVVVAALFLFVQGFAVSHAAQYSDAPHEHNGVACEIALVAPDIDLLEPPTAAVLPPPSFFTEAVQTVPLTVVVISNYSRAPPGRGPPATL